jgi:UDP-N-acetylmuramyl pentapeptide phosphotransferase/UDP-N-acetylglucosamine-1-phosphate transferase
LRIILILLFSSISFLISVLFFPVFIKLFKKWEILDTSGEHKIQRTFIPSMGGISIALGVILTLLMSLPFQEWVRLKYFFISVGLMFLIGLRDDVLALNPKQKLFSQFLPVFLLVFLDGSLLTSLYSLVHTPPFPLSLSWFFSIVTLVIITNAYNLIDGVDGLAGAIGLLCLLFFGVWFYEVGNTSISLISFCFAGSIVAFLFFNWQPSRIFMGDTGALMVGLLLSYLAIRFINENDALPTGHPAKFQASVATAVCVLIIPIFDTLRVILLRIRKMQSPFRADRNHLHHQFLNLGLSHAHTVLILAGINTFFIFLALLLKGKSDALILGLVITICMGINIVLKKTQKQVT